MWRHTYVGDMKVYTSGNACGPVELSPWCLPSPCVFVCVCFSIAPVTIMLKAHTHTHLTFFLRHRHTPMEAGKHELDIHNHKGGPVELSLWVSLLSLCVRVRMFLYCPMWLPMCK